MCKALKPVADEFVQLYKDRFPGLKTKAPRSHSGRRRAINWMIVNNIPAAIAMVWSGIDDPKVFKVYVDLTPEMVKGLLVGADKAEALGRRPPSRKPTNP